MRQKVLSNGIWSSVNNFKTSTALTDVWLLLKLMESTKPNKKESSLEPLKSLTKNQVEEIRQKRKTGVLIKDLMKAYNLSKASVYRYLEGQPENQ